MPQIKVFRPKRKFEMPQNKVSRPKREKKNAVKEVFKNSSVKIKFYKNIFSPETSQIANIFSETNFFVFCIKGKTDLKNSSNPNRKAMKIVVLNRR